MKNTAAWREYAEKKDLARLERLKARTDAAREEYRAEFERVKNYSIQRLRRAKQSGKDSG